MREIETLLDESVQMFLPLFRQQDDEQLRLAERNLRMVLDTSRPKKTSDATSAAGGNGSAASPRRGSNYGEPQ